MKNKPLLTLLLAILSFASTLAQPLNKPKLDSLLNILAENNKMMGSLVLSKNGKVIYSKAVGYSVISDKEKKPATMDTKYRIGSITKMFTAAIVLQLMEEGKLKLATTLDTYFPQLPNAKDISIAYLLNQRSGLRNFTAEPGYETWMTQPKTEDEMLAMMAKDSVDFVPNERFEYSNTNYTVLGYIIEKICKEPYSQVLKDRITSKIGLTNTYAGGKINTNVGESYSYKFVNNWKEEPETDMSIPGGAGCIVSTPGDLAKFIEALFSLKVVSENSLSLMKTMVETYGMGMYQVPFGKKKGYGHNGGIDGFESNLYCFPEDSLTVAVCANGLSYRLNTLVVGVLSIYFNKDYVLPNFTSIALKSDELDKYLGVYSSPDIPLKITITKDGATLIAQATGQSSFSLEATEKDKFKFDQAGIKMDFDPDKNQLTLKQGGGTFVFTKDK